MNEVTTVDVAAAVTRYLAVWNETDPEQRLTLIEAAWAPDGQLTDPPFAVEGYEGIQQATAGVQQQYPGHHFRQASAVDEHHGRFRYEWEFVQPDGAIVLAGIDFGELAEDGRIRRVTGFWGDLGEPV